MIKSKILLILAAGTLLTATTLLSGCATVPETESSQTVDNIDSAAETETNTCEKSADPVRQLAVPFYSGADPEYAIINGKKIEVKRYTLDEILMQSAAKIRAKIFAERGIVVPEFNLAP